MRGQEACRVTPRSHDLQSLSFPRTRESSVFFLTDEKTKTLEPPHPGPLPLFRPESSVGDDR